MGLTLFIYVALIGFFKLMVILAEKDSLCNGTDTTRFEYQFNTEIVKNEYIVHFTGYLSNTTRENHISLALNNAKVSNWHIVKRNNPAAEHNSDFDVIVFGDNAVKAGVEALRKHPSIDRVTAQRRVLRTVKNTNEKNGYSSRKLLRTVTQQITTKLKAHHLWALGITGKGVKVAVFDTGLPRDHPHFGNVRSRTDWTGENRVDDTIGHGTFVAGVIASRSGCLGFAPDAELYIFRVFTDNQVSYTSWFLDAFNYAILMRIDILNLSIGGPDFMDQPFVEKVWELSSNKILMVSAIGNDGPLYGTLNNPADQMDVIGVGGIGFDDRIARFSSRGMTTWELPEGYGRMKPDIVTYGSGVRGSSVDGGCRSLSGTSVASPVVAGVVALLMSGVPRDRLTPASIKQALLLTAQRLSGPNMFEQGHGMIDLLSAYQFLLNYEPQVTLHPPYIDLTECQYMWPYCTQPLYYSAQPTIFNITILNGLDVSGNVTDVTWHPHLPHGALLSVAATHNEVLWPWSGWLGIKLTVLESGADFEGIVEGHVNVTFRSFDVTSEYRYKKETIMFLIRARVIAVPSRGRRLLWDQFHSLRYPSGYFPRDDLRAKQDPLDWHGDHVHTNFRDMYRRLREHGFYVEVMGGPLTCIDTSLYGALLLVDPEDEYFPEEMAALKKAVDSGLSLVVFADWYNATLLRHVKFYDENTKQWWIPETGGSNVPALNDLLSMFQVALGDRVFDGAFKLSGRSLYYASGTHIHSFPEHGVLVTAKLSDQGQQIISGEKPDSGDKSARGETVDVPILGFLQTDGEGREYRNETIDKLPKAGRLVVYGDSSCLESGVARPCHWLLLAGLQYALGGHLPAGLREAAVKNQRRDVHIIPSDLPKRLEGGRLYAYSRVLAADGSGTRPVPPCAAPVPLVPQPVHAPPLPRSLAPKHRPTDPKDIVAPDAHGTEGARRGWRGVVAGTPEREPLPDEHVHSEFALRMVMLFVAAGALYLALATCRRCGRYVRRRKLIAVAP